MDKLLVVCLVSFLLSIPLSGHASDEDLNTLLEKKRDATMTDYTLMREKLLKEIHKKRNAQTLVMAFHRRFSHQSRHHHVLDELRASNTITQEHYKQFLIVYYVTRGPAEQAKPLLDQLDPTDRDYYWKVAQKIRMLLQLGQMGEALPLFRELVGKPDSLKYLHPWVFTLPIEMGMWRWMYFLKDQVWPHVLPSIKKTKERAFFADLVRQALHFPVFPFDINQVQISEGVEIPLHTSLILTFFNAVFSGDPKRLSHSIGRLEYYYPMHTVYLRYQAAMAQESGNKQQFNRLEDILKAQDPEFLQAIRGSWEKMVQKDEKKRHAFWVSKILGITGVSDITAVTNPPEKTLGLAR